MKSEVKLLGSTKKTLKRLDKLVDTMKEKGSVKVGVPKGSNPYPDGTSVIDVAITHEFGYEPLNIPQRSFIRSTLNRKRKEYRDLFKKLSKQLFNARINKQKALGLLGTQVQNDVREKITKIKTPKLKKRKGNPLIDTGHLRQSIVYKVER